MKIEKINDHQIRVVLNHQDLESRQLDINELAYGSDKANELFHEMMEQAAALGFEAEDIPLMIEAIPLVASEGIVLIITKVEDPEELDSRFSRFTPSPSRRGEDMNEGGGADRADNVLNMIHEMLNEKPKNGPGPGHPPLFDEPQGHPGPHGMHKPMSPEDLPLTLVFRFVKLDEVMAAAKALRGVYFGSSSLYKAPSGVFYLTVDKKPHNAVEFNKISNVLSEYGAQSAAVEASHAYMEEHYDCMIQGTALQVLSEI